MADPTPTAATRPAAPFGALELLGAAFRAFASRWPQVLALWAVSAVWGFAPRLARRAAGMAPNFPLHSPAWFAQVLRFAVVGAVLAALTLRLFLVEGRGWWRPDRGFWVCAGLLLLAGLGISAESLLTLRGFSPRDPGRTFEQLGLMYGSQFLLDWIYIRLMLWPIGALMGEGRMTPSRSWALMRGQVAGFVVGVIVLNLPLVILTTGYTLVGGLIVHARMRPDFTWLWIATAALGPPAQILQHAMAAAIYRARTGASAAPG